MSAVQLAGADGTPPPAPQAQPLAFGPVRPERAIAAATARGVVLPQVYYGQLQGLARWQAHTVTGLASLTQLQRVKESLDEAVATGQTFQQWRKDVLAGRVPLKLPRHRLENIFRTNNQASYMRGRGEQMLARVRTHPYWMYDAVNDGRTRPAHRAMDGTVLRFDHPWWRTHYPPNGYQCRCLARALTEAEAKRRGIASYPDPDGRPDDGWDYSVVQDPTKGLQTAVAQAAAAAPPALAQAAQQAQAAQPLIPQGIPVSTAVDVKSAKAIYDRALAQIDSVHGDGVLPKLTATDSGSKTYLGLFDPRIPAVRVVPSGAWPELTVVHEIGHFFDFAALGGQKTYGSIADPLLAGVRAALDNSAAIQGWRAQKQTKTTRYFLYPWEQWARAYAQWVATRSGDPLLMAQLRKAQQFPLRQWDDADFEPIGKAIDDLMRVQGWVK